MAYLVMARKWRPQNFDGLVGQPHISKTLKKAIESGRVSHAYLFTGTRGVGKTTTARILAKALNCEKGPTPEPCGVCAACKEITAGNSMDVIEIDGASNRGIDDVRDLRENVHYSSMHGRYRVFIIDEVHMLTQPAFNALLKTLEEPPPHVVFVFATTEPMRIPQTILSRCQRYDFRRIAMPEIRDMLQYICDQEKMKTDEEALSLIAKKADGSMRDALSLMDQVFSSCENEITLQDIQEILGLVSQDVYDRLLDGLAQRDKGACMTVIEEVFASGYDIKQFVSEFGRQIRNLIFAKVPGLFEENREGLSAASMENYKRVSEAFSDGDLVRMANWVNALSASIRRSNSPRFEIELCLLRMIQAESTVVISDILKELKNPGSVEPAARPSAPVPPFPAPTSSPPVEKKNDIPPVEPSPAPPAPQAGGISWPEILDTIMAEKAFLGTFLSQARMDYNGDSRVTVRFPAALSFQLEQVRKKENKDFIQGVIQKKIGKPVQLNLEIEASTSVKEEKKPIPVKKESGANKMTFNQAAEKEPVLNTILEVFDGEIID